MIIYHHNVGHALLGEIITQRHMKFIQRRTKVDATSWRCIDVDATLSQNRLPLGRHFSWKQPDLVLAIIFTYTTERKGNTKNLHINVLYFVYFILFA